MAKREIRKRDGMVWVDPKSMEAKPDVIFVDDDNPDFKGQAHKFYPLGESAPPLKEAAANPNDAAPKKRPVRKEQLETR